MTMIQLNHHMDTLVTRLRRALPHYETSALFSNRERAALGFTDAVTCYSERHGVEGMPLEPLMRARQHLSEPEIAAHHFFNPITGELGADSSIRSFWL